jgi:hypothetical protein
MERSLILPEPVYFYHPLYLFCWWTLCFSFFLFFIFFFIFLKGERGNFTRWSNFMCTQRKRYVWFDAKGTTRRGSCCDGRAQGGGENNFNLKIIL